MGTKVVIHNVTISYPHLFQPHAPPGSTRAVYGAEFIFDPQRNQAEAEKVHKVFQEVAIGAGKQAMLQYLQSPLKSGDAINANKQSKGQEPRAEIAGKWVLRANTQNQAPAVFRRDRTPIDPMQQSEIFSGCIVNAEVDLYWSNNPTNPGVFAGLQQVQVVDNVNVTALGAAARTPVEQVFEELPPLQGAPQNAGPAQAPVGYPGAAPGAPAPAPGAPAPAPGAPAPSALPWE